MKNRIEAVTRRPRTSQPAGVIRETAGADTRESLMRGAETNDLAARASTFAQFLSKNEAPRRLCVAGRCRETRRRPPDHRLPRVPQPPLGSRRDARARAAHRAGDGL